MGNQELEISTEILAAKLDAGMTGEEEFMSGRIYPIYPELA